VFPLHPTTWTSLVEVARTIKFAICFTKLIGAECLKWIVSPWTARCKMLIRGCKVIVRGTCAWMSPLLARVLWMGITLIFVLFKEVKVPD
jgi:hypothetical protein